MNRSHRSVWLAVFAAALLYLQVDHTAAQQVGLVALDTNEVAKGYRAEALKLRLRTTTKARRSEKSPQPNGSGRRCRAGRPPPEAIS